MPKPGMTKISAKISATPHYLLGLVEVWEIALFAIGVALILAEIFVIPGFGIAGVSGIILVIVSLIVSLVGNIGFTFPPIVAFTPAVTISETITRRGSRKPAKRLRSRLRRRCVSAWPMRS